MGSLSRTDPNRLTRTNRFWDFVDDGGDEAELLLYGVLASEKTWWSGEDAVTPRQFLDELKGLGEKRRITVRINSSGGDVFAASAIHTALREHAAEIVVKVDGIAASAATVVVMAGDRVMIPASAYMMIHNPMSVLLGMFGAAELKKMAGDLDVIKNGMISAYAARTGKDRKAISKLMDAETWLTGEEAVREGFADETMFGEQAPAAVLNGNMLIVNSIAHDLSRYKNRPALQAGNEPAAPAAADKEKNTESEVETMELKNAEDLRSQAPAVYDEVFNAGVAAERARLKAIDELEGSIDADFFKKAKYEDGMTAEKLAFSAMKEGRTVTAAYLDSVAMDAQKANEVPGAAAPGATDELAAVQAHVKEVAEKAAKGR